MPGSKCFNQNKAFSLIELIVAVGILSAGIVFILQAISYSAKSSGLCADITDALYLAENKLQLLELAEKMGLKDTGQAKEMQGKFTLQYALNELDTIPGIYQADINVNWQKMGREESISLNTYFKK